MLLDHQQTLDNFLQMGTRPTFQVIDGGQTSDQPMGQTPTATEEPEQEENVQTPHNPYVAKAM